MKKIISILSLLLVVILGFTACATSKSLSSDIIKSYNEFLTTNKDYINSNTLVSENLKSDYTNHFDVNALSDALLFAKNSNFVMDKLRSYLENETFTKKLRKKDLKELKSALDEYYEEFSNFSKILNTLETTIKNGGSNLKVDYQKLNESIGTVVISGCDFSSKLISIISKQTPITFDENQASVQKGSLYLFVLDCYNNMLSVFSNIYLKEPGFNAKYVLGDLTVEDPKSSFSVFISLLNSKSGSTFDINNAQFASVKSSLLVLQSQNNSIKSKIATINKVTNDLISNINDKGSEKTNLTETAKEKIKNYLVSTITTELYPQVSLLTTLLNSINA